MNRILEKKYGSIKFCIVILFLFCANLTMAQPGWQDLTARYFYAILDEKGKMVSFVNNKDYSIMIGNTLYKMPNIPQDSLKHAIENCSSFEIQISINDFSLAISPVGSNESPKSLDIKIIHAKDTMHICQPSGWGSISNFNLRGEISKSKPDFTLPFKAGHYYFTNSGNFRLISAQLPKISGGIRILNAENLNRDYFIIPKNIYESVLINNNNSIVGEFIATEFFAKGNFLVEKQIELTKFDTLEIKNSWISTTTPTSDPNLYLGLIRDYSRENFFHELTTFAVLNKKENILELFLPVEDSRLFYCEDFFVNNYDSTIYLPCRIKKEYNPADVHSKLPSERHIYISKDEGKTWQENNTVSDVFKKYNISKSYTLTSHNYSNESQIAFIDKNYTVIYSEKLSEDYLKKGKIREQGVYYLLKDMQVIDSLKSPQDAPYYSFNSPLSIQHDSIIDLGKWSYTYNENYFQMSLVKMNGNWKFKVEKEDDSKGKGEQNLPEKDTVKEYKNFTLLNNSELIFKNGSGKMELGIPESIIEKGNQIYLITADCLYISFDSGTTWYLYPFSILEGSYPQLLDINDQNEISYITNGEFGGDQNKVRKVIYKFSPK